MHYNADTENLFSKAGRAYLAKIKLSEADRFTVDLLCEELDEHCERLKRVVKQLRAFAKQAPIAEQEARAVLESMPCVIGNQWGFEVDVIKFTTHTWR